MKVYFAPLSCSLASRIALYEVDRSARFTRADLETHGLDDLADFFEINANGTVPTVLTEEGCLLIMDPSVLQYIADQDTKHRVDPITGSPERYQLQQWLNYVRAEIHRACFYTFFSSEFPAESKTFVRNVLLPKRYMSLSTVLGQRDFLLESGFSVADAHLSVTLNWTAPAKTDLAPWPILRSYHHRLLRRPSVFRAVDEETALRAAA